MTNRELVERLSLDLADDDFEIDDDFEFEDETDDVLEVLSGMGSKLVH